MSEVGSRGSRAKCGAALGSIFSIQRHVDRGAAGRCVEALVGADAVVGDGEVDGYARRRLRPEASLNPAAGTIGSDRIVAEFAKACRVGLGVEVPKRGSMMRSGRSAYA